MHWRMTAEWSSLEDVDAGKWLDAKKTTIYPGLTPLPAEGERRFTLARAWVILGEGAPRQG